MKFKDANHWQELADKYLSSFSLPSWDQACTPEKMVIWLERLDLTERSYREITNTSTAEFIELNPSWPLRAFIGLILELRDEVLKKTGNAPNPRIRSA